MVTFILLQLWSNTQIYSWSRYLIIIITNDLREKIITYVFFCLFLCLHTKYTDEPPKGIEWFFPKVLQNVILCLLIGDYKNNFVCSIFSIPLFTGVLSNTFMWFLNVCCMVQNSKTTVFSVIVKKYLISSRRLNIEKRHGTNFCTSFYPEDDIFGDNTFLTLVLSVCRFFCILQFNIIQTWLTTVFHFWTFPVYLEYTCRFYPSNFYSPLAMNCVSLELKFLPPLEICICNGCIHGITRYRGMSITNNVCIFLKNPSFQT